MSNPQETDWSQIPPYAIWLFSIAALGWVVGPFLGFHFSKVSMISAERRRARYDFLAVIADQLSALKAFSADKDQIRFKRDGFIADSVHQMTIASHRFKSFLTEKEWACLSATLQKYQAHKDFRALLSRGGHTPISDEEYIEEIRVFLSKLEASIPKK